MTSWKLYETSHCVPTFRPQWTLLNLKITFQWRNIEGVTQSCFVGNVLLKILQEKTCARVSFLIKLQAEACNFLKKENLAQAPLKKTISDVSFWKHSRLEWGRDLIQSLLRKCRLGVQRTISQTNSNQCSFHAIEYLFGLLFSFCCFYFIFCFLLLRLVFIFLLFYSN